MSASASPARAGLAEYGQCLLETGGGLLAAPLPQIDGAEAGQGVGLGDPVADISEQSQGLLEVAGRPVAAAHLQVKVAEVV